MLLVVILPSENERDVNCPGFSAELFFWQRSLFAHVSAARGAVVVQRFVVRQLGLELLGLALEVLQHGLELVVLLLEIGGAQCDLVLFVAAGVARSLRRHVVLASSLPVLVVLHLTRNNLLFRLFEYRLGLELLVGELANARIEIVVIHGIVIIVSIVKAVLARIARVRRLRAAAERIV